GGDGGEHGELRGYMSYMVTSVERLVSWFGFVGVNDGFEFRTKVFKFLLADHQSEFDRVGLAESEYGVGDTLFVLKRIIGDKTYGGLAGNGAFLPAVL